MAFKRLEDSTDYKDYNKMQRFPLIDLPVELRLMALWFQEVNQHQTMRSYAWIFPI